MTSTRISTSFQCIFLSMIIYFGCTPRENPKQATEASTNIESDSIEGNYIRGTVTDEERTPVAGVNILLKGTTEGTVSDADGKFILPISNLSDTLVFSFIGFFEQQIPIDSTRHMQVTMVINTAALSH